MSLQELNFNNAGINEFTFNEIEKIDGGSTASKIALGLGIVSTGCAVGYLCVASGGAATLDLGYQSWVFGSISTVLGTITEFTGK